MKFKMISITVFLFILLFGCANTEQQLPDNIESTKTDVGSGEIDGYKLVWEDTFNNGTLDPNIWTIEVNGNGGGNNELQYYRTENISVGIDSVTNVGCLIITARKENYLGKTCTSGRLITRNKVTFKYGKLEARIKLPKTANGLWPAFWMMGNDISKVGWPRCGEIDILEMGNSNGIKRGTQEKYFNGACHWGEAWDKHRYLAMDKTSEYSLQDDFHLYTVEWDADSIQMYLDKDKYPTTAPYFKMSIQDTTAGSAGSYFHKPNFILLNLAIGGNFTGIWDINKVTALSEGEAKMYVDFVKIYQKDSDENKELNIIK